MLNQIMMKIIVKRVSLLIVCSYVGFSYGQDYFNPLFLGSDVASLEELSYLADGGLLTPGYYFLDLYIGDNFIKNVKIEFQDDHQTKTATPCFTRPIIDSFPLAKSIMLEIDKQNLAKEDCIDLDSVIKGFAYNVDLPNVRLNISIPQIYLHALFSTLAPESDWDDGIPIFLVNYNLSGANSKTTGGYKYSSYYLGLNNRLNIGPWRLYGNAYWVQNRYGLTSYHDLKANGIYLSRGINSLKSTLTIGQNTLGSSLFDSITYIGATLASSDEMRPDSEKGYTPPIRGVVETRSKLVIKQNNTIIYQTYVDPGPYDIQDLPPVGSSGDYQLELTSAEGKVTTAIIPYATLPDLLKEYTYNYALTLGQLDITSGKQNQFLQGSVSYGTPLQSTLTLGAQYSNEYQSLGVGLAKDFGYLGALSLDLITAKAHFEQNTRQGRAYRLMYGKSFLDSGTSLQLAGYYSPTPEYYTLREAAEGSHTILYFDPVAQAYTVYNDYNYHSKNNFQINLSQSLGQFGQLYAWANTTAYWGGATTRSMQFGWSKTFTELNNVIVSLSYNQNSYINSRNDMLYLSFSMPLGGANHSNTTYLTNSTNYNTTDQSYTNNTSLYGNILDNRLNYNLSQSFNKPAKNNISTASVTYKANFANLNFGSTYSSQTTQINYGIKGAMVSHLHGFLMAREAYDTSILVAAKGAEGAKLARSSDNITLDQDGYAFIPFASPYRYNEVALDPATFSESYEIADKIKKVAPTRGAIVEVSFAVQEGYSFLTAVNYRNTPILFGTTVTSLTDQTVFIANDDGTVYLTGVNNHSRYRAKWDDTTTCEFSIDLDDDFKPKIVNKLTVDCL